MHLDCSKQTFSELWKRFDTNATSDNESTESEAVDVEPKERLTTNRESTGEIMAERRDLDALKRNVTFATFSNYGLNEEVLAYVKYKTEWLVFFFDNHAKGRLKSMQSMSRKVCIACSDF